jgi:ComF family protein
MASSSWHRFLDLLYPRRCLCCAIPVRGKLAICEGCAADLPRPRASCTRCALPLPTPSLCGHCQRRPPPYLRVRAPFLYAPPLDALLLQLKFSGRLAVAPLLGGLIAQELTGGADVEVIVPVALHRRRLADRGFNQATEIARVVAVELGLALLPRALERLRETPPQSTSVAGARRQQMRGVFRAGTVALRDRRVALLDDVVTTGATAESATLALLGAGAGSVEVWALARTALA